jgi:triosephosphate isomerase (TIM)
VLTIGISLKAYFGFRETLAWCEAIGDLAARNPVVGTVARLVVFPSLPALAPCVAILSQTAVQVGAQTVSADGYGAHTGEVPSHMLAELGCHYAEIGHAERRARYGESREVVRLKVAAASKGGLKPWLCVGESTRTTESALRETTNQIRDSGLLDVDPQGSVIAYEPVWAIGQDNPADPEYVREVCEGLRRDVGPHTDIIYGGSAGPGTLTNLYPAVTGLFLGRFAHNPARVAEVLAEVEHLAGRPGAETTGQGKL